MTKRQKIEHDAEQLVRQILTTQFKQKTTAKQVKEIAKKISAMIPIEESESARV